MQRVALHVALGVAVALLPNATPPARADDDVAAWRRDVSRTLRRGSGEERCAIVGAIDAQADAPVAFDVALDCVAAVSRRERDAQKARDDQGRKLFKFYAKYVLRTELPRERYTEYRVLEIENGTLSAELAEARAEVDLFAASAARASERITIEDAKDAEFLESLRTRIARTRDSAERALVVRSLRGGLVEALIDDLHAWALDGSDRDVCTAALSTLSLRPDGLDTARLSALAECPDPVVRRHVFHTLALHPDVASLDTLVAALEREVGVPAIEVTRLLRDVTGRPLGPDPRAWAQWWEIQRETWVATAASEIEHDAFEPQERSRYFGLSLHSARVLFVLDRSYSMDWPVTYRGGETLSSEDLASEAKFAVAKRELLSALDGLDESTSFNILVYGTSLDSYQARLVPANKRNLDRARRYVEKLDMDGSTNLAGALLAAMEVTRPGSSPRDDDIADTLVVLSDGEPNCGPIAGQDHLLAELGRQNPDGMVTIHAIFLGLDGDEKFMKRLAEQGGGRFVHHTR